MLATKLKKSNKLLYGIVILLVIIPALLIILIYPKTREEVQKKKAEMEATVSAQRPEELYYIEPEFVNYAMESSYYIYSLMAMERGENVSLELLDKTGWVNDYNTIEIATAYQAVIDVNEETQVMSNVSDWDNAESIGTLEIAFGPYGSMQKIDFQSTELIYEEYEYRNLFDRAYASVEQYRSNLDFYRESYNLDDDFDLGNIPKSFHITFKIGSEFPMIYEMDGHNGYYDQSVEGVLYNTGAVWIIVACFVVAAIVYLFVPTIRKLKWPLEILVFVVGLGVLMVIGMYYAMATTSWNTEYDSVFILEYEFTQSVIYTGLVIAQFFGWCSCFLAEYIVIANIRDFFLGPKVYIRERVLCVRIFRWMKRKCKALYCYITSIDISEKLNQSIIKIVLANFVVLTILCCMWVFGVAGLIVYSVALYVLLRKYGEKIRKQYNSILEATEQMAEGDLKISLEEDLGVFQPIGDSLNELQVGFAKAVAEEAKSQNMKTELITNVSHDLKTPLTAIITYVNLLKKEDITEEERKSYINTLDVKSQRLKALIEDLFEVSKAQSGNVKMNCTEIDVVSLIKQVRSEMSDRIDASSLQFKWNLPEEKVVLSLDGQRTYRIFENLIQNILKYAMPYSRVYIDLSKEDEKTEIVFRNISAEEIQFDAEHLTERFVRGESSRSSEGSGLGLAIAKSFTELQGGIFKIEVDGDLFKVRLIWN